MPQPDISDIAEHRLARISHNELCAVSDRLADSSSYDRVRGGSVAADNKDARCFGDFRDGVCHSAATQAGSQTGYRGGVSEARAMIYVVSLHNGSDKLLKNIVFLICTFSGRDRSEFVPLEMYERGGHIINSLFPGDLHKIASPVDKG